MPRGVIDIDIGKSLIFNCVPAYKLCNNFISINYYFAGTNQRAWNEC